MKKQVLFLLVFIIAAFFVHAQAPNAIPYQGVARNAAGNILAAQPISLRISIHDVMATGTVVFSETHAATTNTLGLFNVNIGSGTAETGILAGINWGSGAKFIQVEMDPAGGIAYADMGTTQLNSVPYALYAASSGSSLPPGSAIGNTMRWNGTAWVADNALFNDGTNVGIGTATPAAKLDVAGNVKITDGTEGAGKVLKSNATGLASWGTLSGTDILSTPLVLNLSCPVVAGSVATGAIPFSVAVAGNYAYVANLSSNTMQVINITNPAAPTVAGSVATGGSPASVAVSGNYAYVVNHSSNTMQVINISNPAVPIVEGVVATGSAPILVAVSGSYAYVVNEVSDNMQVINISNPAAPTVAGSVATGNNPVSVAVSGNYAYVANLNSNTMQVINITNPAAPTVAGSVATGSYPSSVAVSGNYAYVTNYLSNAMQVINISNPAAPIVAGSVATGSYPNSVAVSGNYAYVVNNGSNTIQVINISNPAAPIVEGSGATGSGPVSVAVLGNYAYVVNINSNNMKVINLACSQNFAVTVNPATGQTTAIAQQWNTSGNDISNANGGNVGIGTATPDAAAKLEVAGQVKITGGAPGLGKVLTSDGAGLATWATPTGGLANGAANGNTPYWNGTAWITNTSNIFNNGTNAGVGTTNPTHKFEVVSSVNSKSAIRAINNSTTNGTSWSPGSNFSGVSGESTSSAYSAGVYGYQTGIQNNAGGVVGAYSGSVWGGLGYTNGSGQQFGVYATGNGYVSGSMGIGTATPSASAKLEVAGRVKITGGVPGLGKVLTSDGTGLATWEIPSGGGLASGTAAGNTPYWDGSSWVTSSGNIFNNGTNVGIGTSTPDVSAKLEVAGQLKITGGAPALGKVLTSDGTGLATWETPTGGIASGTAAGNTPYWDGSSWITNSSSIFNNGGNVGIGTTTPATQLDITKSTAFNITTPGLGYYNLHLSAPQNSVNDEATGITFGTTFNSAAQAGIYVQNSTAYGTKMYFGTTNDYATGSQTRMTIDDDGNVGIGTISPANKLDVAGGLVIGGSYSASTIAPANGALIEGNVGIGTTTTANKLDVEGGMAVGAAYSGNTAAPANGAIIQGNVGIGVSIPSAKLEVRDGSIKIKHSTATASLIIDKPTGVSNASNEIDFADGGTVKWALGGGNIGAGGTNDFSLYNYNTASNNLTVLNSNGNVGIGTTGPSAKLSVNGSANNTTGAWGVFSDARVKTVTDKFTDGLNVINKIQPVKFVYNEKAPFKADGVQIGVVAQNLEEIAPYMVSKNKTEEFTDLREVNNQAYTFLLINSVKEQQTQIEDQKSKIEMQNKLIQELSKRLDAIEKKN